MHSYDRNRNLKVKTTISMDADMYGMTVRGRTIYYCTENKGLKMLSLSDIFLPIWNICSPSLLKKLTVIVTGQ
jgi:hypothetical protein